MCVCVRVCVRVYVCTCARLGMYVYISHIVQNYLNVERARRECHTSNSYIASLEHAINTNRTISS